MLPLMLGVNPGSRLFGIIYAGIPRSTVTGSMPLRTLFGICVVTVV